MNHIPKRILSERLWETGFLPSRWMLTYLRKNEIIALLRFVGRIPEGKALKFPDSEVEKLRKRQESHLNKNGLAKKNREVKYGSNLTAHEILKGVSKANPKLSYVEKRNFSEPFESATGSIRGLTASVFIGKGGEEFLFTNAECRFLRDKCGVVMPAEAWGPTKGTVERKPGQHTLSELFD